MDHNEDSEENTFNNSSMIKVSKPNQFIQSEKDIKITDQDISMDISIEEELATYIDKKKDLSVGKNFDGGTVMSENSINANTSSLNGTELTMCENEKNNLSSKNEKVTTIECKNIEIDIKQTNNELEEPDKNLQEMECINMDSLILKESVTITPEETIVRTPEITEEESLELSLVLSDSPKEKLFEEPEEKVTQEKVTQEKVTQEKEEKVTQEKEEKVTQEKEEKITEKPEERIIQETEKKITQEPEEKITQKPEEKITQEPKEKFINEPKEILVKDIKEKFEKFKKKLITEPTEKLFTESEESKKILLKKSEEALAETSVISIPIIRLSEKLEIKTIESDTPISRERRESKRKRSLNPSPTSPVEQNGTSSASNSPSKRRKFEEKPLLDDDNGKNDRYCWRCHKESIEARCTACPRSWHRRCMGGAPPLSTTDWICSECTGILQAEKTETKSVAMTQLSSDQLSMMLKYVVERMTEQTGSAPFLKPVDTNEVPNYLDYIKKPMDLSLLESNVSAKFYASTDAFMADAKWIQHNCIIFNTYSSKLTNTAKQMLKVARQEVSEIEACPDCFSLGRNLPRPHPNWFIQPCCRPHPIVWAKLKGFPFWPAKALSRMNSQGLVDVRFFGEHDRAWVSPKDIYLYSNEPPAPLPKKKKPEMDECMKEVEDHSKKLREVFGEFRYAPPRIQYDPHNPLQIQVLLPQYDPVTNKRIGSLKDIRTTPLSIKVEKRPKASLPEKRPKTPLPEKRPKTPLPEKRPKTPLPEKRPKTPLPDKRPKTPLPEKRPKTPLPEKQPKTPLPEKRSKTPLPEKRPKTPLPEKRPKTSLPEKRSKTPLPDKRPKTPLPDKRPKTPSPKNVAGNLNGVTDPPIELRKSLRRKQMEESPPETPVEKVIPESQPEVILIPKKKAAKSLSSTVPIVNINNKNESKNSSSQNTNSEVKNNSGIKKVIAKNLKNSNIKKIKLVKDLINKDEITITTKSHLLKNGTVMASPNPEILKSLKLTNNSKTIYIQKPNSDKIVNTIFVDPKLSVNSSQIDNKIIKVINKAQSKGGKSEINVFRRILPNVQKNAKGDINKPMTAIPISTEKDQLKTTYQTMNSNSSESARQLNDKEIKLNNSFPIIKQEPKDDVQPKLTITRKPSKARKSLPTKSPNLSPVSPSNLMAKSSPNISKPDSLVYVPPPNSVLRSAAPTTYQLPPPNAGPNTAQIHNSSKDLATKIAQLIAETIKEAAENNDDSIINQKDAKIQFLKLSIEKMKWEHQQEISELKHNNEIVLRELRASMEVERYRALQDARREAEIDKIRSIEETKRKQWCVACGREAKFYCCWNTAYCDYPCQQKHWSTHFSSCNQKNTTASVVSNPVSLPISTPTTIVPQTKGTQKQPMPKLVIYKPKMSVKKV